MADARRSPPTPTLPLQGGGRETRLRDAWVLSEVDYRVWFSPNPTSFPPPLRGRVRVGGKLRDGRRVWPYG